MVKQTRDDSRQRLAEEAAEWLLRLEEASPREKREFVRWLKSSKDAPDEILLAKSTDVLLRQLLRERPIDLDGLGPESENIVALAECGAITLDNDAPVSHLEQGIKARDLTGPRTSRFARSRWLAAAVVGVAAAIAALAMIRPLTDVWLAPNVYTTSVGEQRAIEIADGSLISINAKSRLRVAYSTTARDVYLETGQAMFTVAKDAARPFRVHVDSSVVQAVGTKFDVRVGSDRINVSVVEGVVQITDASHADTALATLADAARVAAGQAVTVDTGRVSLPTPISIADISAWQQRRLVFRDNTLEEITEEFARFNRIPHLKVEGDSLRTRRFSGVFDADAPEALLTYLASDESIVFSREGDDIVIRPRTTIETAL